MSFMVWNVGCLWSQCSGIGLHLELILDTPSYFSFLQGHQHPDRLVTVFLVNLSSSIKQIKAPYMFDKENPIALHATQGNVASPRGKGKVSYFFSTCFGNLWYILALWWGWPFKPRVCSSNSKLLSSYEGHTRNLVEPWQGNKDASRCESGNSGSLSSCHSDIGILINFQEESGIVTF